MRKQQATIPQHAETLGDCTPTWGDTWQLYTNVRRKLVTIHWHAETDGHYTLTCGDSWKIYTNIQRQLVTIHQHAEATGNYKQTSGDSWLLYTWQLPGCFFFWGGGHGWLSWPESGRGDWWIVAVPETDAPPLALAAAIRLDVSSCQQTSHQEPDWIISHNQSEPRHQTRSGGLAMTYGLAQLAGQPPQQLFSITWCSYI